jgi:hypothetical protein
VVFFVAGDRSVLLLPLPFLGITPRTASTYFRGMQANDPADTSSRLSLIEALTWLEEDYRRRAEEHAERTQLLALATDGIAGDLAMELHAECSARGLDWNDLLICAVVRCLQPTLIH